MIKQYTPRRASLTRWLASAPEYILDVFRLKDGSHEFLFTGERMLQSGQAIRTFANTQVQGWYEHEGWFALTAYECVKYRARMAKRRVKWQDVPQRLRITVIQKVEDED